eukprot:364968-Chlamydomonas_euryale.AAC.3
MNVVGCDAPSKLTRGHCNWLGRAGMSPLQSAEKEGEGAEACSGRQTRRLKVWTQGPWRAHRLELNWWPAQPPTWWGSSVAAPARFPNARCCLAVLEHDYARGCDPHADPVDTEF